MAKKKEKLYTYRHPHPAVTVDVVIFSVRDEELQLLLIERGVEPFKGAWALPGGFVRIDEALHDAAVRELAEETGLDCAYLEQLGAFGQPDRDPRERVISIPYFAVMASGAIQLQGGSDARRAEWRSCNALPPLAFDHERIVNLALKRIADRTRETGLALLFLPEEFTLSELQRVHELLLGESIDKRNFRKWANSADYLEPTGRKRTGGQHRPAALFRAVPDKIVPDLQRVHGAVPAHVADDASETALRIAYANGYKAALQSVSTAVESALANEKTKPI